MANKKFITKNGLETNNVDFVDNISTPSHTTTVSLGGTGVLSVGGSVEITGNLGITGTVDGRDVATDGAKLDTIEGGAEVNVNSDWNSTSGDSEILNKPSLTLDAITTNGNSTTNAVSLGNITTTGYIRGPEQFILDPAAHGDNTGTVVIAGNLQVDGTTTTINSTVVEIDDLNIKLATGSVNKSGADGSGLTIDLGSDGIATLLYSGVNDWFQLNKNLYINSNRVITSADEGSGNLFDADKLDGQHGSYYAPIDSPTFTGPVTATTFVGNLTGSAAKLTTARTIGGVSFDGSANINLPGVNIAGNQNTTGSAAKLTTARSISGASFDGSADVIIPSVTTTTNGLMVYTDKVKLDALNSSLYAKLADNNTLTGKNTFNTDGINQITLARSSDTVYGGISLLTGGQLNWLFLEPNDGTGNLTLQSRNYKSAGEFMQTVFNVDWATGVMNFPVSPTILGSKVWTAGNDGAGTGLDADKIDGLESTSFLRSDVDTTKTAGKTIFNDGITAYFGTDQDASIFHNGTNMAFSSATGSIYLGTTTNGNNVFITAKDSGGNQDTVISAKSSGADTWASLYFNNTEVLKTTSTGVEITGGVNSTYVEVGKGSGSAALTYNDGYGNCNVTFNHRAGTPDFSGNAGRIQVNTDSSTGATFTFHLSSGVTAGVAGACPTVFTFSETSIAFSGYQLTHAGQLTNVVGSYAVLQNKTGSTCILDASVSGASLNKDPSTAIGTGTWRCKQYTLADGWGLFQRTA